MSDSKPTNDDLNDRLVDRVLAEALGGERPPDLSQAILVRAEEEKVSVAQAAGPSHVGHRPWIALLSTAAALMIGVYVLSMPAEHTARVSKVTLSDREPMREESVAMAKPTDPIVSDIGSASEGPEERSSLHDRVAVVDGVAGTPIPTAPGPPTSMPAMSEPNPHLRPQGLQWGDRYETRETRDGRLVESSAPSQQPTVPLEAPVVGDLATVTDEVAAPFRQGNFPPTPLSDSKSEPMPAATAESLPTLSRELAGEYFDTLQEESQPSEGARGLKESALGTQFAFRGQEIRQPPAAGSFARSAGPHPFYSLGDLKQPATPSAPSDAFGFAGGVGGEMGDRSRPRLESWSDLRRLDQKLYREPPSSDRYESIHENDFLKCAGQDALSTFSVDVDTASYSNVRQHLLDMRRMPPPNAVRIEELVNYFEYAYQPPKPVEAETRDVATEPTDDETEAGEAPFAASISCFSCPWKPENKLVRVGVKGREVEADKRPLTNLTFLVDVSGSMNQPNKLPLVVSGLNALVDRLGENDRVAIAVYAGSEGLVLPSTTGDRKDEIRSVLGRLTAGGSTAGGAGLRLAYDVAERNKIVGGVNRVVLCTDGDFNVGMTGTEDLARFVESRAKETGVYLTVLGFGRGNLNDAMLEQISGRGDGAYAYIDSEREARRVLSQDLSKTLVTIAKDVKMQVEFNPAKVASYRLIGYENRVMAAEDFNNDAKDAGDIGAGHTVTAMYEVVPAGVEPPAPPVDDLKYQHAAPVEAESKTVELLDKAQQPVEFAGEMLTLKIRYKQPEGGASKKLEFPLVEAEAGEADSDARWAAAVAEFGMLLRNSRYVGDGSFDAVLELARGAVGDDPHGYRAEFLDLVRRAKELSGR